MILLFNFFISNDICLLINFFIYIEGGKEIKLIFFIHHYTFYFYRFFLVIIDYSINITLTLSQKLVKKKNTRFIWIQMQGLKYVMPTLYPLSNEPLHCTSIIFSSSSSKFFPRLNSYREKYASKAEKIAEGAFSTFGPKCFILRKKNYDLTRTFVL